MDSNLEQRGKTLAGHYMACTLSDIVELDNNGRAVIPANAPCSTAMRVMAEEKFSSDELVLLDRLKGNRMPGHPGNKAGISAVSLFDPTQGKLTLAFSPLDVQRIVPDVLFDWDSGLKGIQENGTMPQLPIAINWLKGQVQYAAERYENVFPFEIEIVGHSLGASLTRSLAAMGPEKLTYGLPYTYSCIEPAGVTPSPKLPEELAKNRLYQGLSEQDIWQNLQQYHGISYFNGPNNYNSGKRYDGFAGEVLVYQPNMTRRGKNPIESSLYYSFLGQCHLHIGAAPIAERFMPAASKPSIMEVVLSAIENDAYSALANDFWTVEQWPNSPASAIAVISNLPPDQLDPQDDASFRAALANERRSLKNAAISLTKRYPNSDFSDSACVLIAPNGEQHCYSGGTNTDGLSGNLGQRAYQYGVNSFYAVLADAVTDADKYSR